MLGRCEGRRRDPVTEGSSHKAPASDATLFHNAGRPAALLAQQSKLNCHSSKRKWEVNLQLRGRTNSTKLRGRSQLLSQVSPGFEGRSSRNVALSLRIARFQNGFSDSWPASVSLNCETPAKLFNFELQLFSGTQCRAKITELIVDLIGFVDGQANFFAEESAITNPHLMDEPLHRRFGNSERF